MGKMIIASLLSATIFSFLFYILNNKVCKIFKPIQRRLINLNKVTRHILSFSSFILIILICVYLTFILNLSAIGWGLVYGFLSAIVDTCFSNNIIESIIWDSSKKVKF